MRTEFSGATGLVAFKFGPSLQGTTALFSRGSTFSALTPFCQPSGLVGVWGVGGRCVAVTFK